MAENTGLFYNDVFAIYYVHDMTRKDVKGDQPSGGETTWTNTGATRYGRGQHKTGSFGDDMLRPSPNHGTQRLPNDDDDVHSKGKNDSGLS